MGLVIVHMHSVQFNTIKNVIIFSLKIVAQCFIDSNCIFR
jgi:hypothetical protein